MTRRNRLSRRRLLDAMGRVGSLIGFAATFAGLLRGPPAQAADGSTFAAYLDTLIPADADGPGALDLDVPKRLAAAAANDPPYSGLIDELCRWLDERARAAGGSGFADLAPDARAAIIRAAESADAASPARRAVERTRKHAFTEFYGDPRAWPGIGYYGPPQPEGFPDYSRPPASG